jgi:hypothetical protein
MPKYVPEDAPEVIMDITLDPKYLHPKQDYRMWYGMLKKYIDAYNKHYLPKLVEFGIEDSTPYTFTRTKRFSCKISNANILLSNMLKDIRDLKLTKARLNRYINILFDMVEDYYVWNITMDTLNNDTDYAYVYKTRILSAVSSGRCYTGVVIEDVLFDEVIDNVKNEVDGLKSKKLCDYIIVGKTNLTNDKIELVKIEI